MSTDGLWVARDGDARSGKQAGRPFERDYQVFDGLACFVADHLGDQAAVAFAMVSLEA